MAMRWRIDNLKEVKAAFATLPAAVVAQLGDDVREAAELGADVARAHVPVLTGRLKGSIGVAKATGQVAKGGRPASSTVPTAYRFYAAAPYGHYVEYGTKYVTARPFMRPGIDAATVYLQATVKAYASTFHQTFLGQLRASAGR